MTELQNICITLRIFLYKIPVEDDGYITITAFSGNPSSPGNLNESKDRTQA